MLHTNWVRYCQENIWAQPSLLSKIPPRGSQALSYVAWISSIPLPFALPQGSGVTDDRIEILFLYLVLTSASPHSSHVVTLLCVKGICQVFAAQPWTPFLWLRNSPAWVFSMQSPPPTVFLAVFLPLPLHPQRHTYAGGHEQASSSLKRQLKTLTKGLRTQRSRYSGVCTEKAVGTAAAPGFKGTRGPPHQVVLSNAGCWLQNLFSACARSVAQLCPTLFCPLSFPGKNTGVCCHFLSQGMF